MLRQPDEKKTYNEALTGAVRQGEVGEMVRKERKKDEGGKEEEVERDEEKQG